MNRLHSQRDLDSVVTSGPPHVSHFERFLINEPDLWRHNILPRLNSRSLRSLTRTNRRVRDIIKRHASDKTRDWDRFVEPNRGVWTFRSCMDEWSGPGLDFVTVDHTGRAVRANPGYVEMSQQEFVQQQPSEKFRRLLIGLEPTGPYHFLNHVRAEDLQLEGGDLVLGRCLPRVDRVLHLRQAAQVGRHGRGNRESFGTYFVKGDDRIYLKIPLRDDVIDGLNDDVFERVGGLHLDRTNGTCNDVLRRFPNLREVFLEEILGAEIVLPPTVTHLRAEGVRARVRGDGVRFLDEKDCDGGFVLPNLEVSVLSDQHDRFQVNVHS